MTGVDDQALLPREIPAGLQLGNPLLYGSVRLGVRVSAGVQLDGVAARLGRSGDLLQLRRDEGADQDPLFVHPPDDFPQPGFVLDAVQPAFGRQFLAVLRHERHLVGPDLLGDLDDRLGHRHLQIQLGGDALIERPHVAVVDVPAVLAQVHGDSVGPGQLALRRRPDRVRLIRSPRLADGRHVIDIDIENCHRWASEIC